MLTTALLISGLGLLFLGGEALVRGSAALALRFGLTPLFVGLTIVSFGTSSPELAVSISASVAGQVGVAVGNVVGSNIANIGLILGISALLKPIKAESKLVLWDVPIMIAASFLVAALLDDSWRACCSSAVWSPIPASACVWRDERRRRSGGSSRVRCRQARRNSRNRSP
jgi:cation:H+ antiporter